MISEILLRLLECAEKILRVQEEHRLALGANARFAATDDGCALPAQAAAQLQCQPRHELTPGRQPA